ncbi:MAG: FAD-dependent pyridine nucleotide-disulfide oxidoreductase [Dehalococcoidia bacterium]|nr:FAD-dependent pyridine nucleotide-disulfide oxidoreductase [Dehalococcoidia bacterium]
MSGKTIVILGGGFGGLAVANQLRRVLPPEHRVVVVERQSTFYMRPFNMRLMIGEMKDRQEGERRLSELARKGIEWVQGEVLSIDPTARKVHTSSGPLVGDYLVIALGAEQDEKAIPGFAESALNLYDPNGAIMIHRAVQEFAKGRAAVLICRTPFSCPAAPYEAALLMDSAFRSKGNREAVEIAIYTPEPRPMPAAGPEMGNAVIGMLKERDIKYHPQHKLQRVNSGARKIVFEGGEASFDLLVGIPPHVAPRVVREAGLTDDTGWIPVEPDTLETRYPGVFALGDVTSIRQPNPTGLFLPKAWVFADEQSRTVAKNIASHIKGEDRSSRFDGTGFCYVETGDGLAAYGSGNFYAYPAAKVYLEPPSPRHHEERKRIELEQLEALV